MNRHYFCLVGLLLISFQANSAEKDYMICSVAGFYEANNNRFLTDLAERVAAKNNLFGDENCTIALREGKAAGERFSKPGAERRVTDYEIVRNATHFSNLIYDSILSRIKF
jgi:hypothetical protein